MALFRTKWESDLETFDFETSAANEALNGLARETGKLSGAARVSSVALNAVKPLVDASSGNEILESKPRRHPGRRRDDATEERVLPDEISLSACWVRRTHVDTRRDSLIPSDTLGAGLRSK